MSTLWISNMPDLCGPDGHAIRRRWSIVQVDVDRRGYGAMEGHRGKDAVTNGCGNYIFYRLHVSGISPLLKGLLEQPVATYPSGSGEFRQEIDVKVEIEHGYYLDIDALPEWARISLDAEGEATLPAHIAYPAVKRWIDGQPDPTLYTYFSAPA